VYCLCRSSSQSATDRLASALKTHSLSYLHSSAKIYPLTASLSEPNLGLEEDVYASLQKEATHIIHCAWTVNFSIPLSSFVPQLLGLQNLLSLSLSTPTSTPAKVVFCSSISAALGTKPPAIIPSDSLPDLKQASPTGYGRSKLVAEKILQRANELSGADAKVLRIGQITPSREEGMSKLWNPSEMIPLLVRSAAVVKALPDRVSGGDSCEWIEVGVVAKSIADVCGLSDGERQGGLVYNIVHLKSFSWKSEFLPKLREAGMDFETVGYREWLEKLRATEADVEKNPSRKLLEFWDAQRKGEGTGEGVVKFDTSSAVEISPAVKEAARVVDGSLVKEIVEAWREAGAPI
jgi:thioester reductase-like protein